MNKSSLSAYYGGTETSYLLIRATRLVTFCRRWCFCMLQRTCCRYWQFRQDRTWGGKTQKKHGQAGPKAAGPTEAELAAQLSGLRQRARTRKPSASRPPSHHPSPASGFDSLNDVHWASGSATASASSDMSAHLSSVHHQHRQHPRRDSHLGHFGQEQMHESLHSSNAHSASSEADRQYTTGTSSGPAHRWDRHNLSHGAHMEGWEQAWWTANFDDAAAAAGNRPDASLSNSQEADVPRHGLDRLAGCIRYHLASALGASPFAGDEVGVSKGRSSWHHSGHTRYVAVPLVLPLLIQKGDHIISSSHGSLQLILSGSKLWLHKC